MPGDIPRVLGWKQPPNALAGQNWLRVLLEMSSSHSTSPLTWMGTACRAQISWNTCLPACSQGLLPNSASCGVACAVTVARRHLQLALPCRIDGKPVTFCSCLQHSCFHREILLSPFLHLLSPGCKCFRCRDKCHMEPQRLNTSTVTIKTSDAFKCYPTAVRGKPLESEVFGKQPCKGGNCYLPRAE